MNHFQYHNGILHTEDIAITDIASMEKTPFYVYSSSALQKNLSLFRHAFHPMRVLIAYAIKANSNQAVLTLLAKEGAGADVVSEGEIRRALASGIPAQRIVYSGVGKKSTEMDFALANNILCFNVESEPELIQLSQRALSAGKQASISLRINPDIDSETHQKIATGKSENKFGIPLSKVHEVYRLAASLPGIRVDGIDIHIGSQICKLAPFDQAFSLTAKLVHELRREGHTITHVDIGGGLGISYQSDQNPPPSPQDYAAIVHKHIAPLDITLILEPGRALVGNAGMLITSVIYLKKGAEKNFIIVDCAMNDLIRPTLYDAWHAILPVVAPQKKTDHITADIVGPVCETGDYLGLERQLPPPHPGDLLAIASAGAYGAVMSNTYNTRPTIPEILVHGNLYHIIRSRPRYEDILGRDSVPDWLTR
ncbi:MAG: ornithine decarboxylase [Candidatus Tokpelaia sp. JSC161]|jgi:diaminopimelate decarboxylase|nr:MAG: ornithine decarboxylase [Candidatus Tokpelaia sp. JSC161]